MPIYLCTGAYKRTRRSLVDFFTEDRPLESITPGDAEDWRIWLATKSNRRDKNRKNLADETVRRRSGRAKQFFNAAIKRGLIESNPFEDLVGTQRGNPKRQHFVHASVIYDCIEHAPDTQWRTIIALCRFGGLRCPTEVLGLKWSDVDLPGGKMTIHAPKTAHCASGGVRACPIFPELRPYLEDAEELAPPGTVHVITRYRDTNANLRTTFKKIISRASHQPWPRLFQNLRATRETELMAKYPAKDVAAWLGNSVPVAMLHYAMATAESFERAIQERSTPEPKTLNGGDSDIDEKGEAEPEARSWQTAKHKPKRPLTDANGPKEQTQKKPRENGADVPVVSLAGHCKHQIEVHPRGVEHSRLREPVLRITAMARALKPYTTPSGQPMALWGTNGDFSQEPYGAPSVFNFYLPDFQPPGDIIGFRPSRRLPGDAIAAPEFQILDAVSANKSVNRFLGWIRNGWMQSSYGNNGHSLVYRTNFDYSDEMALLNADVNNLSKVLEDFDLRLCNGSLSDESKDIILDALTTTNADILHDEALIGVLTSPDCMIEE